MQRKQLFILMAFWYRIYRKTYLCAIRYIFFFFVQNIFLFVSCFLYYLMLDFAVVYFVRKFRASGATIYWSWRLISQNVVLLQCFLVRKSSLGLNKGALIFLLPIPARKLSIKYHNVVSNRIQYQYIYWEI